MEILTKKTTDITPEEAHGIYDLFELVFKKKRNVASFYDEYCNTSKGYSYHAIAKDGEKIIAHNVYVPFKYLKDNIPFYLALSIDAMVHPDYRGKGLYGRLVEACGAAAIRDGCKMRIGFPNENSYPVQIKKFKFNDIGSLNTYCLPVNIGAIYKKLRILTPIGKLFTKIIIGFSVLSKWSKQEYLYKYRKDRSDFDNHRYKWFDGDYEIVEYESIKFVYKNSDFKGQQATFLMDVFPLSKKNFDEACRYIYRHEKTTPIILYVGNLPFFPLSMMRIPKFIEPKHFHFVGKIFDKEFVDEDSLKINNWEVNLSNYDLL